MRLKLLSVFASLALPALSHTAPVKAAPPPETPAIVSLSDLRQDARLNVPVKVAAKQYYLGELVELLREQTGVSLSVSDRGILRVNWFRLD